MASRLNSSKTLLEGMEAVKFEGAGGSESKKRDLAEMIRVAWKQ